MKKKKSLPKLMIKSVGNFIKSRKFFQIDNRPEKHQPRWMYRNE